MYDLWLLSNQNAVTYWEIFKKKFPHAKRYILESSIEDGVVECARQSFTNMLYTVSDKLDIVDDWDFSFCPDSYENTYIHIFELMLKHFGKSCFLLMQDKYTLFFCIYFNIKFHINHAFLK